MVELLAQSSTLDAVIPLAIILVISCALMGIVLWVRRRLRENDPASEHSFSLSDLRRLRDSGQISEDEFIRAKAKMVADTHQKLAEFSSPDLARERNKNDLDHQPRLDVPPQ